MLLWKGIGPAYISSQLQPHVGALYCPIHLLCPKTLCLCNWIEPCEKAAAMALQPRGGFPLAVRVRISCKATVSGPQI